MTTAITGGLNLLTPKIGGAGYSKAKITVTWRKRAAAKTCPACAESVSAPQPCAGSAVTHSDYAQNRHQRDR